MKKLAAFTYLVFGVVFVVAGCGTSHDDMMKGGAQEYNAAMDQGMASIDQKAVAHRAQAVKLPDVKAAVDLEAVHRPDMMGEMDGMDNMMSGMMDCHDSEAGQASMGEMMGDMSGMRDEMNRHDEAIKNCKGMDEVRQEEETHLAKMKDMMDSMRTHKGEMMSGGDEDAACPMMEGSSGSMMDGGGMMGR